MTLTCESFDARPFIPHRGRLALIDTIEWIDRNQIAGEVKVTLKESAPYFSRGQFQSHWLIELAAQASAAISQASRLEGDAPAPFGYLISIRHFTMIPNLHLKAGDVLLFDIHFEVQMSPVGQSRCYVLLDGRRIAEGEMTFVSEVKP